MTALAKESGFITPEEYLEGELLSEIRHEYVYGLVFAMAGASVDYNRIVANLSRELGNALRGRRYEPFSNDMKVRIHPTPAEIFYYPDLLVACDPTDNARFYRERPSVVFEVMSEGTRHIDEREKMSAYHSLTSLQAHVLVDQDQPAITVLHRREVGWDREALVGLRSILKLSCIDAEIPLSAIYERTRIVSQSPR